MKTITVWTAIAAGALAPWPRAQAVRIERHLYARTEQLRGELLAELTAAEPVAREAASACFADPATDPLEPFVRAFARLRGVEADAAMRLRGALLLLALPGVVDLDGGYDGVHVTLHLPRRTEIVGQVALDVVVRDRLGEEVGAAHVDRQTELDDLLRFRATTQVGLADRPDGAYALEGRITIGADEPRPFDLAHGGTVHLLRGFARRAGALPIVPAPRALDGAERLAHIRALEAELGDRLRDPADYAAFQGVVWQVQRLFDGEPLLPGPAPAAVLETAERALANLRAGSRPLAGLTGRVALGVAIGGTEDAAPLAAEQIAVVDIELPDGAAAERPLVLFVPGTPAWNAQGDRPTAPRSTPPQWLAERLRQVGFDREGAFHVAVMESPGRFANAPRAVVAAARALAGLVPVRAGAVVLVGEREGAYAVTRAALLAPDLVRGVVAVTGGALSEGFLRQIDGTPLLAIEGSGHPASVGVRALAQRVAAPSGDAVRFDLSEARPWPVAVELAAERIAAFVAECTRE